MSTFAAAIQRGTRAAQPAASAVIIGTLYCVTDEGNKVERSTGAAWAAFDPSSTVLIEFIIDGGGSAITTGIKGDIQVPFAATITAVRLLADQSGSIVVDIWKDTYANYPPTVADTITAGAKPTISSATKSEDTTLTGWTTTITAGDILRFNVDSITTVTRVAVVLVAERR